MLNALILESSYFDDALERESSVLVWPNDDGTGVSMELWPNNPNNVQIIISRQELLAMLDLISPV